MVNPVNSNLYDEMSDDDSSDNEISDGDISDNEISGFANTMKSSTTKFPPPKIFEVLSATMFFQYITAVIPKFFVLFWAFA